MKYGYILRKLIINNQIYLQIMDKISGYVSEDNKLKISDGPYKDKEIVNLENINNELFCFMEIDEDTYENVSLEETIFLKIVNGDLTSVEDPFELNMVMQHFYDKFKDFVIIPDYDLDKIIIDAKKNINNKLLGQQEVVDIVLTKIYNNQMFIKTELDDYQILNNKSNILVVGPFGSGKSTLKKLLKEELEPIPVIECKLTGNYKDDVSEIIKKLLLKTDGNILLAMRGIVIYDGINLFSSKYKDNDEEDVVNIYLDVLQKILSTTVVNLVSNANNVNSFDCSFLTHISFIDMLYKEEKNAENHESYKVSVDDMISLGVTFELLKDCFDDDIIFMNEMTPELAMNILKNKDISPIYAFKRSYEKQGKKVKFSRSFVTKLIEYGLTLNEGFTGILRVFKYIIYDKNLLNQYIYFSEADIENLKDTMEIIVNEEEELEETVFESQKNSQVDIVNKTIDGLTVMDTVNIIKENIKGQDEHIFKIVNNFFKFTFNKHKGLNIQELKQLKDNILIIGGTGVGKTAIIEELSNLFSIPYVREDATRYSGAGLVGENIETMIKDLVTAAGGDRNKAQNGIIFIDEIDKITSNFDRVDIGRGVQNGLLTLIEGSKRTITPEPKEMFKSYVFDTTGLLFVGAGAFAGLEDIKNKRIKKHKSQLGFTTKPSETIDTNITIDDLSEYGMDRQLIRRMACVTNLNILNEKILLDIINNSKSGYINLNKKSYEMEGIKLTLSEGFKKNLAKRAYLDKKGASSIKTIFLDVLTKIDEHLNNNSGISEVVITDQALEDEKAIVYIKTRKNRKN